MNAGEYWSLFRQRTKVQLLRPANPHSRAGERICITLWPVGVYAFIYKYIGGYVYMVCIRVHGICIGGRNEEMDS